MRASGLQGDASPEIIEIFDDDTNAFGDRAPSHTVTDSGGPRWIGPAAAAALVALIGYGVATSAPTPSAPKASPVTSSTVSTPTTSTTAPTPTTVPAPPVPYYGLTAPAGYSVQFADIRADHPTISTTYNLWATPGATASSGSWFSINVFPSDVSLSGDNAYRTVVGDVELAISPPSSRAGGITFVMLNTTRRFTVQVVGFGLSDQQLIDLATSIDTDGSSIQVGTLPAGPDEYRLISTVDPSAEIFGAANIEVYYGTTEPQPHYLGLTVGKASGRQTIPPTMTRFLLNHPTRFATGPGTWGTVGNVVGNSDSTIAVWIDRGNLISLSGNVSITQLVALAKSVQQVSADEWAGIEQQMNANRQDSVTSSEGTRSPVSFGTDASGLTWKISAAFATYGAQRQINWDWGSSGNGWQPTDAANIRSSVDGQRTYVLSDLPRAVAATATLRVTRNGMDPVDVPFNDIDPTQDRTLAAYAFSEPVPFDAEIVGPDGTVIATWPTP